MRGQINTIIFYLCLGLLLLQLGACQQVDTETQPKEHIFSAQEKALRQAQGVQAVIDAHAAKTREQID